MSIAPQIKDPSILRHPLRPSKRYFGPVSPPCAKFDYKRKKHRFHTATFFSALALPRHPRLFLQCRAPITCATIMRSYTATSATPS